MGRNPVVGRQGPKYHAAVLPTEPSKTGLQVRQVRSTIGHAETMRRTMASLGLHRHQQVVVVPDNPSVRGMLFKVRHLVEVSPAQEA
ncbi:MAG: 50S ribosomal protein L30 [Gemmatimonadales bacterium]|nr:50S ribosomal protein L30 [Gemmatimonadales bacterium]